MFAENKIAFENACTVSSDACVRNFAKIYSNASAMVNPNQSVEAKVKFFQMPVSENQGLSSTLTVKRATDTKPFTSPNPRSDAVPKNFQESSMETQAASPLISDAEQQKLEPAEVVIFNNSRFDSNNKFHSDSIDDIGHLMTTFGGLKCKMTIFPDATIADIRSTMQDLEEKNLEDRSAVVVVILSLCHQYETIAARDGDYNIDNEIIFPLLRNGTLINKPKMLFVQATKGSRELDTFWPDTDSVKPHGAPSDILKCYCTYEDYVSLRNPLGMPFIRELCHALRSKPNVDIESIVREVTQGVMNSTHDCPVPLTTSTMTTKYAFGDFI